jgi:hypothetical protein
LPLKDQGERVHGAHVRVVMGSRAEAWMLAAAAADRARRARACERNAAPTDSLAHQARQRTSVSRRPQPIQRFACRQARSWLFWCCFWSWFFWRMPFALVWQRSAIVPGLPKGLSFISSRQRRKEGTFCASGLAGIEPTPARSVRAGYARLNLPGLPTPSQRVLVSSNQVAQLPWRARAASPES